MQKFTFAILMAILLSVSNLTAQTPGLMVRPAGTAGPLVLDPDGNGYTSALTSGFTSNDITSSEIPYKLIPALLAEPTGDLLRGPDGFYSEIVKTFDGSGFYMYASAGNLMARIRMGGLISGSKGYSVLLDTDLKFGATGPNADPNYKPRTNGNNGNPGFEFEVVYETNFRVAIYNVDGTSTPVLVTSYPLASNSQISIAATLDGGNTDFFYDFYVPYAAMGLANNTPVRAIATTVMCPCPAIGGPKSDIYGVGEGDYMDLWTDGILLQPPFTPDDLQNPTVPGFCTKAPVITTTDITPATTTVNVAWTKSSYSAVASATIQLYSGPTPIGAPTVIATGGNANITIPAQTANANITATALGTGETACSASNLVKVNACNANTHTPLGSADAGWPTCASEKGMAGTKVANASVMVYRLTSAGYVLYAADVAVPGNTFLVTYPNGIAGTRWQYDGGATQSADPCGGGSNDIPEGAYMMVSVLAPNCASVPTPLCAKTGGSATITPSPVITSMLTDGALSISGTSAGAAVSLFINDYFVQSVTVTSGTFTFPLTTPLAIGQSVSIYASRDLECLGAPATGLITCYIGAPVITTDSLKRVTVGTTLKGTSTAPAGTAITVYNAAGMGVIGTATAAANGDWTMATPNVTAGINYLARITGSSCGNSALSDTAKATAGTPLTRCGTITIPVAGFIQEDATSVSGTVTGGVANTVVTLYADSIALGSYAIPGTGTAWTVNVNTNYLNQIYPGAVLTIGIAVTGLPAAATTEVMCSATATVTCKPIPTPIVPEPPITAVLAGQTVTYTVLNSQAGILYSAVNNATGADLGGSRFGNGGVLTITTNPFTGGGTYNVDIKATSFSGATCFSTATRTVLVPLTLTDFSGRYEKGISKLSWETEFEAGIQAYEVERAYTVNNFSKIGSVTAVGNSQVPQHYSYDDADAKGDIIYYRLKILDNSTAGFKYSKVLMLRPGKGIVLSNVSPNPFTEAVQLKFDAAAPANMTIRIVDMMGRPVKTNSFISKKGMNTVVTDGLRNLAAGSYIIELSADGERIFKQQLLKK